MLRLLHEIRDANLSYLSKDENKIKKFVQCELKFVMNISCFDEEARGCTFHFVEIFCKNE